MKMTAINTTKFDFISLTGGGRIARLELNRPEQANAFSSEMMVEITDHIKALTLMTDVRALVITGSGKHFSAGADLNWMKTSAKLSYEENVKDASKLLEMFDSIANLTMPKIALIRGAAYGGAVGMIACCDYAIAAQDAKFCLSEVKLGLLPAVIAPYLLRKMKSGMLKRFALTGMVFSARDAFDSGLVEIVTDSPDQKLAEELNLLLACSPTAQISINQLFTLLREDALRQSHQTVEAIAKARTGKDGQDGLSCFFSKTEPPWLRKLES